MARRPSAAKPTPLDHRAELRDRVMYAAWELAEGLYQRPVHIEQLESCFPEEKFATLVACLMELEELKLVSTDRPSATRKKTSLTKDYVIEFWILPRATLALEKLLSKAKGKKSKSTSVSFRLADYLSS
jgi:hypothetical protein